MSEATDAILDIKEALQEFGTDIVFQKITAGAYSPTGTTTTKVETNTKALIKKQATKETQRAFLGDYEIAFMLYLNFIPTKADKIKYKNEVYNIVYVATSTLQNADMKYEILGKK